MAKPSECSEGQTENGHMIKSPKRGIIDIVLSEKKVVWDKRIEGTYLEKFRHLVNRKFNLQLKNYWDLHKWSIENYEKFWEEIWHFVGIICHKSYEKVVILKDCFIDIEWFPGVKFNYAENLMRYRDDHVALICVNEQDVEDKVTYSELYQEVKRYAAALKRHGFKVGDTIGCYMSNRKEAIFAMLATASLGGLFGGPQPFYGARAAGDVLELMKPKILFTVERFQDEGEEYNLVDNLSRATKGLDSVEKVVVVPIKQGPSTTDISKIRHSCFLKEFLDSGREKDGAVPDLVFEQLPFNQPLFIGFTSGTTGMPKGLIHSAGNILPVLKDKMLHQNLTRSDVSLLPIPVGWNAWNTHVANLAVGLTILLYEGTPHFLSKTYFWDLMSKYKVTNAFLITSTCDRMEKEGIIPGPEIDLKHLKTFTVGASPVKPQNFDFIKKIVHENVLVGSMYGASEFYGTLGSVSFNDPVYSGEIQVPSLGSDLRCFNKEGHHVWAQRGELVVATPNPSMPVNFLHERDKIIGNYFSKYPGVWCQHDEAWFDPDTKGFIILGRSDETLNPGGERFGSADIYSAIHVMDELRDYLCVGQTNKMGEERAVLFVKLKKGYTFSCELVTRIRDTIKQELVSDFVPEIILETKEIPYNLNRKRMERLVKTIISTNKIPEVGNIRNSECLKSYCNIPELQGY